MKMMLCLALLMSFSAFSNVVPEGAFEYQMKCDDKEEGILKLEFNGLQTLKLEWADDSSQTGPIHQIRTVTLKNQTVLDSVNNADGWIKYHRNYVKTKLADNKIEVTRFSIGILGGYEFQDRMTLKFTSTDLSRGELTTEYFWGNKNLVIKCEFAQ